MPGSRKQLGDGSFIDAIVFDEKEPSHRFSILVELLP